MQYDPEKLRAVLDAQGRRVAWLADQLEYDETHVSKVLNYHTPFSEKFARKAARVLGVPVEWLAYDHEPVEAAS